MASELLCIIFLCTIIFGCSLAEENGNPKIEAGIHLIPGPYRIYAHPLEPVHLDCNSHATNHSLLPLSYSWLKDGAILDSSKSQMSQNGTLYIDPRIYEMSQHHLMISGHYECRVTTIQGDSIITRQLELIVAHFDKVNEEHPRSTRARVGGAARFMCDIRAQPSIGVQWIKDNTHVFSDDHKYTVLPSGILQISPVEVEDEGLYWCESRYDFLPGQFGEVETSKKATLTVIQDAEERPPVFLARPQDTNVELGEPALLECLVDGNPLPKVEWKKRGAKTVIRGEKLHGQSNLEIKRVTLDHDGIYDCVVHSPDGRFLNASATLNVVAPPKFETETLSYVLTVAMNKVLHCNVSGRPKPQIKWYHNGNQIMKDARKKIKNNGELHLIGLQKDDTGFYQCIANNSAGVAISVARIITRSIEKAPAKPQNLTAIALNSTVIQVFVNFSSDTTIFVIWYSESGQGDLKNSLKSITNDANFNDGWLLEGLKPYTNYSVYVQAFKPIGGSEDSDTVYVHTKEAVPNANPSLSLRNPDPYSILVSWTPLTRDQSRGKLINYRVYYKTEDTQEVYEDVPADQTSFYITDVKPETTYYIQVIARTGAGFSSRKISEAMKHTTPTVNASSPPTINLQYINDTSVSMAWQSPRSSQDIVESFAIDITNLSEDEPLFSRKHIRVDASVHSIIITDLNYKDEYEVTLMVQYRSNLSGTSRKKFQLSTIKLQSESWHLEVAGTLSDRVSLSWTPVANKKVYFEVCHHSIDVEKDPVKCSRMSDTSWTVKGLLPFTRYLFRARALLDNDDEVFSTNVIVRTNSFWPSPPLNVTVSVLKPKVVRLQWLPPLFPNGRLSLYRISYAKQDGDGRQSVMWDTKEVTSTSAVIDKLSIEKYIFRVTAINSVGESEPSQTVTVVPECRVEMENSCRIEVTSTYEPKPNEVRWSGRSNLLKIICITAALIFIIFITIVIICLYKRRCQHATDTSLNSSHTPFSMSNGHAIGITNSSSIRQWNGHAGSVPGVAYGPADVLNPHEHEPILSQMVENVHMDSKGASDHMRNGFYHNGVIRSVNKPASVGQQIGNKEVDHNLEEYHGLMATLLQSNNLKKSLLSNSSNIEEEIPLSYVDFRDHGRLDTHKEVVDEQDGLIAVVDHSSEDSGTECRPALGMLGSQEDAFPAESPASSPGGLSVDNQHHLVWNHHLGDELGDHLFEEGIGTAALPVLQGEQCQKWREGKTNEWNHEHGMVDSKNTGRTFSEEEDEITSNDRDSGHGGEVKSQVGGTVSSLGDSGHADLTSDIDTFQHAYMPGDMQTSAELHCLSPSSQQAATTSLSSSPPKSHSPQLQLPHYNSNSSVPSHSNANTQQKNSRYGHHRPHHTRGSLQSNHTDLPLPPPPPPPPSSLSQTLASPQCSSSYDSKVELSGSSISALKGSSLEQEQKQLYGSSPSQSQDRSDISFSPPTPPPSPPNIV